MRQHLALTLIIATAALTTGCAPSAQSLLGQDEAAVRAGLGRPEYRHRFVIELPNQPRLMGPRPAGLLPGEEYTSLFYPAAWGEQWSIFLASPAIFERIHKRKALTAQDCVVDVQRFPKGAVF
ncbi:MAG: hypothetical protein WD042_17360 [Phycisphaeraceae bacterium]